MGSMKTIDAVVLLLLTGILAGFVFGIAFRNIGWQHGVWIVSVFGIFTLLVYIDTIIRKKARMEEDTTSPAEEDTASDEDTVLSPDEARQWLDDFLVKQQKKE
jgi:uncharacterized membrane protein YfcA